LLVLSAFFVAAAVTAFVRVEATRLATLLTAVLTTLLAALLTAGRTIVLRITTWRMLAAAFSGALLHALISLSVVCHNNPPLFLFVE
jgi:hypothetical protein